jgi:hypothetical protein
MDEMVSALCSVCFLACFCFPSLFFDLSEQGLDERGGICHRRASARRRVMIHDASLAWYLGFVYSRASSLSYTLLPATTFHVPIHRVPHTIYGQAQRTRRLSALSLFPRIPPPTRTTI